MREVIGYLAMKNFRLVALLSLFAFPLSAQRLNSHAMSGPLNCVAASASGTAYTCTTTPSFTPVANDSIIFIADVASGTSPTLNVNGSSAATIKKQGGGTNLIANDLLAGTRTLLTFDGTFWQMQGQIGNSALINTVTNYTSSGRVLGTIYQNTGNKPLYVSVWARNGSADQLIAKTDTFTPPTDIVSILDLPTASKNGTVFLIVLPGSYYSVGFNGGTPTLGGWFEWT